MLKKVEQKLSSKQILISAGFVCLFFNLGLRIFSPHAKGMLPSSL